MFTKMSLKQILAKDTTLNTDSSGRRSEGEPLISRDARVTSILTADVIYPLVSWQKAAKMDQLVRQQNSRLLRDREEWSPRRLLSIGFLSRTSRKRGIRAMCLKAVPWVLLA